MATTTPNFGWSVPTSSDLVKNGATAIETLGDSIDASLVDLKGGTTGQVLAKATNTDMDFSWTTPSAGGGGATVLVSRTSFSNVASQSFDSVFTSTYKTYQIVIESIYAATAGDDLRFTFRYGATDSANHYGCVNMTPFNSATIQQISSNNVSYIAIAFDTGNSTYPTSSMITVYNVPASASRATMTGMGAANFNSQIQYFGGYSDNSQTYTGFKLASSSSNITGTVSIYGLKDA